ncbi:peptidyl-tRNA hydrolase [Janthinobacterium lividum]|uniref:peptidylprolyl isomerase n=1 Tax=Janthinobacterium lividum TaxID=29581 RepID=A0A1S1U305_9BURK|nr:EpsD family peptidyl-prolyl cis-trans isomerase [Janthinobacterium lividum]OHV94830.1 peptidyl-tRNA hydrolase [Janthinobacterium lividum]
MKMKRIDVQQRILTAGVILLTVAGLAACGGDKQKKVGQALASVNGEEITALQLNEELQRAGVPAAQQEAASKQLLEALIDRQVVENVALKEKIDRDPKVMQAIERAKALIISQAYMQKKLSGIARPSKAEVEDYFNKHPELFSNRKQFDMRQLLIASKDMNDALKQVIDKSKSLDEVAAWMESNKIGFARGQVSRTTTDLAPELVAKLQSMPKGQLFIINEGERAMLMTIVDIKEVPVKLAAAAPQIEQYLVNTRAKDAAKQEMERLRAAAKIEYLNQPAASAATAASGAASAASASASAAATARGVAGLK